eukprot:416953-Rhodomonas_salina.3
MLRAYNIPDAEILASLYSASPFTVTTAFGSTATIRVGRGCRQGNVLSPLMFNLFVNLLLRHLNASGVGAFVTDDRRVNHKGFADDLGMVTHSLEGAQTLMDRMAEFCKWSGMEVNMLKTKVTAIDYVMGEVPSDLKVEKTTEAAVESNRRKKERAVCTVCFDGDRIDFVPPAEPMPYLGYELTLTGDWTHEIQKIKVKTARIATVLHKHKFTESQGRYLFQCLAIATFRYSVGVAQWTRQLT